MPLIAAGDRKPTGRNGAVSSRASHLCLLVLAVVGLRAGAAAHAQSVVPVPIAITAVLGASPVAQLTQLSTLLPAAPVSLAPVVMLPSGAFSPAGAPPALRPAPFIALDSSHGSQQLPPIAIPRLALGAIDAGQPAGVYTLAIPHQPVIEPLLTAPPPSPTPSALQPVRVLPVPPQLTLQNLGLSGQSRPGQAVQPWPPPWPPGDGAVTISVPLQLSSQ